MRYLISFLIFWFGFYFIQAQVDSTQIKPKVKAKWNAELRVQGQFNRGNITRNLFSANASLSWEKSIVELTTSSLYQYGELNGQVNEREFNVILDGHLFHQKRFYLFVLGGPEISRLRGIKIREYGVGGPGWNIIRKENHKVSVSNGLMYEHTEFVTGDTVTIIRNSFRLKGKHSFLKGKLGLKYLLLHQAGLSKNINNRMSINTSLDLGITKILSASFGYSYIYESVVAEGRKNADQQFLVGLAIKL